ncbi:MAG: hypothetical protein V4695_13525 [Pseudomonadota bacterium]
MFFASISTPKAVRTLGVVLGSLLSLSACGGYTAVDVGGTITGLTGTGLQLANGGSVISPDPSAVTFVFPNQVEIRAPYSISVVAQPARQNCSVVNGSGTAGAAPVTVVNVVCVPNAYALGGRVTGLTGSNLILTNGSDRLTVPGGDASDNASFTFPTPVADGTAYGVAILTQPSNQVCNVSNGTALMGSAPVDTVLVICR